MMEVDAYIEEAEETIKGYYNSGNMNACVNYLNDFLTCVESSNLDGDKERKLSIAETVSAILDIDYEQPMQAILKKITIAIGLDHWYDWDDDSSDED